MRRRRGGRGGWRDEGCICIVLKGSLGPGPRGLGRAIYALPFPNRSQRNWAGFDHRYFFGLIAGTSVRPLAFDVPPSSFFLLLVGFIR
jgi:hypothetical protein